MTQHRSLFLDRLARFVLCGLVWLLATGSLAWAQGSETNEGSAGLRAVVGHVVVLPLPAPVRRVVVGDAKVADFRLVSPTELYVLGKSVGTTNLLLWRPQGGPPQSITVTVAMDTQPLADSMRVTLPLEHDIGLRMAAGSVVLSGTVANSMAFDAAASLADAFMRPVGVVAVAVGPSRVINLLRVRDAQQVMLDVRIAEVSKTLLDKLGLGVRAGGGANPRWNILSSFLGGGGAAAGLLFGNGNAINLEAEKKDGLVRILAEPSIVAMSGQEGSFLVGGKVFIPIAQAGVGSAVTLQEREFGVGLKFVPTVLDGGRVSLKVATEVSEISKEAISVSSSSGTAVLPAFTTRRVATAVQLLDGQSLAIGGLIRNNFNTSTSAFPLLGEIPILGALFRSTQFSSDQTELVVVVRVSLVQASEVAPGLPSDNVAPPSRGDLFLDGHLQAPPAPLPEP